MDRSGILPSLCCSLLATLAMITSASAELVPVTPGFNAGQFVLTPDGSRAIFARYNGDAGVLYSARTDGVGSPVPISPLTGGSASLFDSRISPDGAWIVYNRYEFPVEGFHVSTFASRVDGSLPPVLLNTSKVYDDDPSDYSIAISPDSRYAVVRADQGDQSFDLLSRRIDGSTPAVSLNGAHGGGFGDGVGNHWTGAGGRVVFHTNGGDPGPGFYSRTFDGSGPLVPLSPHVRAPAASVVSADGSTIVFTALPEGETLKLYSNSTAGGALRPLPLDTSPPFSLRSLSVSPDGNHALVVDNEFRLLTLPTDGSSAPTPLGPFPDGRSLGSTIAPDGSRVAYIMRDGSQGVTGLFVSAIGGSGTPTRLSGSPPPLEDRVVRFGNSVVFTNDGRHLVYSSDEVAADTMDLFSVPVDGSRLPVRLIKSTEFTITPDGQWVVAPVNANADSFFDRFVAIPIGGGEPLVLADNPYPTGGIPTHGSHWHLSEDGGLLVFLADNNAGVRELFAVAIPEPGGVICLLGTATALLAGRRWRAIRLR